MHQASEKIEWEAKEEGVVIKIAAPFTADFLGTQRSHE
jgi:hypothetical protein